jgi:ribosomal protein S4
MNSTKAELNSWKAAVSNEVRVYQDFCNRNLALKNREDELQLSINELEIKETELQKTSTGLKQQLSEHRENNVFDNNLDPEIKQEEVISINDISVLPLNIAVNYHPTENNEILHHHPTQAEPSSRTLIFDTKDLY